MCGGSGGDALIGRRKRCILAILLSAIKIIDSFCPQPLDTNRETDETLLPLLLHTNVLYPFFHITSLRSLLRHFLSNHPHENLIPWIYYICVYILYVHLHLIRKRS